MQRDTRQRYIPALIDLNDLGGPKMVGEMLTVLGISERSRGISRGHLERLRKLAYLCENHRPVDARSFTHHNLHTPTCGCDKEQYLNEDQAFNFAKASPLVYSHGNYYGMGKRIGKFGWTVEKKKNKRKSK